MVHWFCIYNYSITMMKITVLISLDNKMMFITYWWLLIITTLNLYWCTLRTEEIGGSMEDIAQFSTPLLVWTTALKGASSTLHYTDKINILRMIFIYIRCTMFCSFKYICSYAKPTKYTEYYNWWYITYFTTTCSWLKAMCLTHMQMDEYYLGQLQ